MRKFDSNHLFHIFLQLEKLSASQMQCKELDGVILCLSTVRNPTVSCDEDCFI